MRCVFVIQPRGDTRDRLGTTMCRLASIRIHTFFGNLIEKKLTRVGSERLKITQEYKNETEMKNK